MRAAEAPGACEIAASGIEISGRLTSFPKVAEFIARRPTPLLPMTKPARLELPKWPKLASAGAAVSVPLAALAHARSGDKGDMANIGVIARAPEIYPWLVSNLSARRVKQYFAGICEGQVERHARQFC